MGQKGWLSSTNLENYLIEKQENTFFVGSLKPLKEDCLSSIDEISNWEGVGVLDFGRNLGGK